MNMSRLNTVCIAFPVVWKYWSKTEKRGQKGNPFKQGNIEY